MLTVEGVNQAYGGSQILWDMSLEVPEGSCTCLMGRNGVGKTTLLRAIMGAVRVQSGKISFAGADIAAAAPEARARRGVGYVPQGREIFPQLTVGENLELGVVADGRRRPVPARIFELFPVLKTMLERRGGDLSGGQQQQLASGEWIGLAKLSGGGARTVRDALGRLRASGRLTRASLVDLLADLLAAEHRISVVYVGGHWLDVDDAFDLARAREFP
jgi:ABC-type branched-subunit amino acid transport system ATPase component